MAGLFRTNSTVTAHGSRRIAGVLLTGLLCAGATAVYAQQIKKIIPVQAKPTLLLRNQSGAISIKTWDQNQIQIEATPSSDTMEVTIFPGDRKIVVQTHARASHTNMDDAHVDFEITIPHEASVRIDSERGQIAVENVKGDITVEGVSNSVGLANLSGEIMVHTVDGPILLRACEGHIEAHSISGELKLQNVNATELVASSNSGAISYEGDFGGSGHYVLRNYQSSISIIASDKASFALTARAVQGSIENDLAVRPTPLREVFKHFKTGKILQGLFRNGGSDVQVSSYNGTIRLRGPR